MLRIAFGVALVVLVPPASAQGDPLELGRAIIALFEGPGVEVVEAPLPSETDVALLPPGAVPLGGFRTVSVMGMAVVARVPVEAPEAVEAYVSSPPSGWRVADREGRGAQRGVRLCGEDAAAQAVFVPRAAGGAYVAVYPAPGPCDPDEAALEKRFDERRDRGLSLAPELAVPPDAVVVSRSRSGGSGEEFFALDAYGLGVASKVAADYAAELRKHGWALVGVFDKADGAASLWSRPAGDDVATAQVWIRDLASGAVRVLVTVAE